MSRREKWLGRCALAAVLAATSSARALPPLQQFISAAREHNVDNREAVHRAAQADHEAVAATGALLPYATAQARYTRNQYEVKFNFGSAPFDVAPRNQYDVLFTVATPLVDAAGWAKRSSAQKTAEAARLGSHATELDVERQIVAAYYRFAAALAVVTAADTAHQAARENLRTAETQRANGAVPALDVQRATAELAAVEESVANAELGRELARRELASLTGIEPDDQAGDVIGAAVLNEEEPLENWQARAGGTPAVRAANANASAGEAQTRAAKLTLVPTLEASAQERFTNATAFSLGHSPFYTIMGTANWRLDFTELPRLRAQREAGAVAQARADRARIEAGDGVHRAWWTVHASIARVRAASARATATRAALESARARYEAGAGTQLDALQAVRDSANADVASIQASANLAVARAFLRLAAGESLARGAEHK